LEIVAKRPSQWLRGAETAAWIPRPKSTTFTITRVTALMTRRPPGDPAAMKAAPFRRTSTGVAADKMRLPGPIDATDPGTGSNHIVALLSVMPVPLTTTADPKAAPSVEVSDTRLPSRSTTLM
jgi:hypothetical protein